MICPNSKCSDRSAEYRDDVSDCPYCGTALVDRRLDGAKDAADASSGPVPCFTLTDASLVPQAKAILDAAGIPYFVKNDAVQNLFGWGTLGAGHNFIAGPPVVTVEACHVEQARQLLSQITGEAPGAASSAEAVGNARLPSSCSRCKQAIEPPDAGEELTHCYHCGWPLAPA